MFWWMYSLARRGGAISSVKRISPVEPLRSPLIERVEALAESPSQPPPCSVSTNFSRGKRSNTPDSSSQFSGRCV